MNNFLSVLICCYVFFEIVLNIWLYTSFKNKPRRVVINNKSEAYKEEKQHLKKIKEGTINEGFKKINGVEKTIGNSTSIEFDVVYKN